MKGEAGIRTPALERVLWMHGSTVKLKTPLVRSDPDPLHRLLVSDREEIGEGCLNIASSVGGEVETSAEAFETFKRRLHTQKDRGRASLGIGAFGQEREGEMSGGTGRSTDVQGDVQLIAGPSIFLWASSVAHRGRASMRSSYFP